MPGWSEIQNEILAFENPYDVVRRKYLKSLSGYTGRNTITYYSGWLQKEGFPGKDPYVFFVNDTDKNGFMSVIHDLDPELGLDLVLHTPGGDIAATESLVEYLHSKFSDIRAIIPQMAMSAGTMIALSCREIIMGRQSSIGPIDPQYDGVSAHGVVEESKRASDDIKNDPLMIGIWEPILSQYSPAFIGDCRKAIDWANVMVKDWLIKGMFDGLPNAELLADKVLAELSDHALTLSHSRHISAVRAKTLGIKVMLMEDDQFLQDHILSLHHACVLTLSDTMVFKLVENQNGSSFISSF